MSAAIRSADLALAGRLEAAESEMVLALAQAAAQAGMAEVQFERIAGGVAIFAGAGSPMTHAMGLGMAGRVEESECERLETFFRERGSGCVIDLCPMADPSLIGFVQTRPYRAVEFNNVMARRLNPDENFEVSAGIRRTAGHESGLWARVIARAFSESMPVTDEMIKMLEISCGSATCWLAEDDGFIGGAAMRVQSGVAVLFGDAVQNERRRRGWQGGLIRARLAEAQSRGCDLAMASVLPGSTSHRNYERAGFELLYMRINLMREFPENG